MLYDDLMSELRKKNFSEEELRSFVEDVIDDYHYENEERVDDKRSAMRDIIDSFKEYIIDYVEENPTDEKVKEITESFDSINVDDFIDIFDKLYHANFKMTRMKPTELFKFFF